MATVYTKSKPQFISEIAPIAIDDMKKNGILASITIAQAILESGYGNSELAKGANNLFGMKCSLSGNTWSGSTWDGVSKYTKQTAEDDGTGKLYYITADFRKYQSFAESIRDHSAYLLGAMNGKKKRYEGLRGEKDPKKAIQIIKDGGYATSTTYVEKILNIINESNLTQYDKIKEETSMSNSSLVSYTKLSPNHSGKRTHAIDRITPHCVVGQCSVETLGNIFFPESRQASCNYGIGVDGRVGMYVEECNRSWCSSSNSNDQRAVTIECASDKTEPYAFNDTVYNRLIDLCVDICKRNGKSKLIWIESKDTALAYEPKSDEMLLTVHRWFANKSCPGNWMYSRMGELASVVTSRLGGSSSSTPVAPEATKEESTNNLPATPFIVRVIIDDLNIRSNPSMGDNVVGQTGKGSFTILEVKDGWGRLKSGAGWIWLENPSYCTILASSTPVAPEAPKTYKDGDIIKLKPNATYWNGKSIPAWVFEKTLYYRGKNENGIIFSILKTGDITGVVKESALQ